MANKGNSARPPRIPPDRVKAGGTRIKSGPTGPKRTGSEKRKG